MKRSGRFLTIVLAIALLPVGLLAQESRGTILGRVLDPSGAIVAGARVEAVNLDTNTKVSATTNQAGNFEFPYMLSGTYRVSVEMTGFKRLVREGIQVRVNDRLTLDFALQIGELTHELVVTGETPLLDTATASMGTVVDARRITELPMAGGNAFYLARFTAGIAPTGGHTAAAPSGDLIGDTVVQGNRPGSSDVTMDGTPSMYWRMSRYSNPPQDLVQEIRVQTVTHDASLGHATGAVVNLSTKSGTRELHGTAYLFDMMFRATSWFNNRNIYNPATGAITPEKIAANRPDATYRRWGATAGGPVRIPGLYDGSDRTFWSFGYEGFYTRPGWQNVTATVPTAAERRGDFSALLSLGSRYQIYDPLTIAPATTPGRFTRQPLAGNIIPASRISPIAQKILTYWPEANQPGTSDGRNNYFARVKSGKWEYRSLIGRVDHNFSNKHRFFARLSNTQIDLDTFGMDTIAAGDIADNSGYRLALDDVYVFRPDLLLNVRYGIVFQSLRRTPFSLGFDIATLGFPQNLINEIRSKSSPEGMSFPLVRVDGGAYTNLGEGGRYNWPVYYQSLGSTVTKIRGNHSVKLGGEFRLKRESYQDYGNVAPELVFAPTYTNGPLDNSTAAPIGQGLASMLLGIPSGGTIDITASYADQSVFTALFVQDDWKVSRRLTINLGLRHEYHGPPTERFDRSVRTYDFQTPSPIQAQAQANYAKAPIPEVSSTSFRTMGGLTFVGVDGQPRTFWDPAKKNFAPRVGLAFQITPKTVLRAGYSIYFETLGIDRTDIRTSAIQWGFTMVTPLRPTIDNGITYRATLANPFPDGLLVPRGAADGIRTRLGQGLDYYYDRPSLPYAQRWSFGVQRELPGRMVVEAAYIGNRGTRLEISKSWNSVPAQYLSKSPVRDQPVIDNLSLQVPSPFYGISEFTGTSLGNLRVPKTQLLVPYPHFGGMTTVVPAGYSYYHSMQLQAERRLDRGITFQTAFTWSKLMEAIAYLNATDPVPEKVISSLDFPKRFSASAIYELPFGSGKPLLGGAGRLLDLLVGGWQMQGTYELQSGPSLGFGNVIFYGDPKNIPIPKSERSVDRWFNTNAGFERDTRYQLASNLRAFPSRFSGVRGDGTNMCDLSVLKNFRLREGMRMQFRVEATNAFNSVDFGNPNTTVTSTAFGTITGERGQGSRRIDFGLKLIF